MEEHSRLHKRRTFLTDRNRDHSSPNRVSSSLRPVSIHEVPDELKEVLQRRQKLDASIAECEIAMGMPRIDTRIDHPQPPGKTPLYEDPRCPVRQVQESLGDLLAVRNSQLGRTSLPQHQQQRVAMKSSLDPEHEKDLLEIEQSVLTTTALHKKHQSEKHRLQGSTVSYPTMQQPHAQMYQPQHDTQMYQPAHQTQPQPMQMPVQKPLFPQEQPFIAASSKAHFEQEMRQRLQIPEGLQTPPATQQSAHQASQSSQLPIHHNVQNYTQISSSISRRHRNSFGHQLSRSSNQRTSLALMQSWPSSNNRISSAKSPNW